MILNRTKILTAKNGIHVKTQNNQWTSVHIDGWQTQETFMNYTTLNQNNIYGLLEDTVLKS